GTRSSRVMHVAGVDVAQPIVPRNVARTRKCCGRRRGLVHHLPVRMERGEMQRHIGTEFVLDPLSHLMDFPLRVVLLGNEERRDLEPYLRFTLEVLEGLE